MSKIILCSSSVRASSNAKDTTLRNFSLETSATNLWSLHGLREQQDRSRVLDIRIPLRQNVPLGTSSGGTLQRPGWRLPTHIFEIGEAKPILFHVSTSIVLK